MCLPGLLIGVPFVAAILAFCLRGNGARNILVKLAAAVTMVLSVGTAIRYFGHPAFLKITGGFCRRFCLLWMSLPLLLFSITR